MRTKPLRYKVDKSRHYCFFAGDLTAKVDIFTSKHDNLKRLKIHCAQQLRPLLAESPKHNHPLLTQKYHRDYRELELILNDFYHLGVKLEATSYREARFFSIRDAKVDYYFNWQYRLVLAVSDYFPCFFLNLLSTLATSILVSPFMLINSVLNLFPLEKLFAEKKDPPVAPMYMATP